MIQLSECKLCSDTCRDYIQKYSYITGIQLEMLKASIFRTLGVIQDSKLSVQLPVAEHSALVQIRPQGLKTKTQDASGKQST